MSSRLKDTLDLIRKYALPPPPPPGSAPAKAPPGVPVVPAAPAAPEVPGGPPPPPPETPAAGSKGTGVGGGGIVEVIEMQKAIQRLATQVTAYSTVQKEGTEAVRDDRKDFNDFLAEQYLATSDTKGVEWGKDPRVVTQPQKAKQATDLTEMDIVIDAFKRIGSGKKEFSADGVWGFRTHNALRNVYAFATALLDVSDDFGKGDYKIFNHNDLEEMYNNIPMETEVLAKLDVQQKKERAKILAPLIDKVNNYYQHYVRKIATNPSYRGYIEGQHMFSTKNAGEDPSRLNQAEVNRLNSQRVVITPVNVPTARGTGTVNIPLLSLKDANAFKTFLVSQSMGYNANQASNPAVQKAVLKAIMDHVQNFLSRAPGTRVPGTR